MSWGYWFELEASLPRAVWNEVSKQAPKDHAPGAGWSRFRTNAVAKAVERPPSRGLAEPFAKVLARPVFVRESVHRVGTRTDPVAIRLAVLLDRSQLGNGAMLAAFLEAIRVAGGEALLRVVSDGTAPESAGWLHRIRRGAWTHERLDEPLTIADRLAAEVHGDEPDEDDLEPPAIGTTGEHALLAESASRFSGGDAAGARTVLEAWLDAGHPMTGAVLQNYAVIARQAMPGGAANQAVLARVRGAVAAQPLLARIEDPLVNVLLLFGEHGAAAEAVDLALDAVARGHQRWTGGLALNATWAATVARDRRRSARLLAALRAAGYDPTRRGGGAFDEEPRLYANTAELHVALGEPELALACVARAVRRVAPPDPELVRALGREPALAPLHADPRWPQALRGSFAKPPKRSR